MNQSALDHSDIYRSRKIWHWHHKIRLRTLIGEAASVRNPSSIADIGCSSGYVTSPLQEVCDEEVVGFDYLPELVETARSNVDCLCSRGNGALVGAKFCAKTLLGYSLEEFQVTRRDYLLALLRGKNIS